MACMSPMLNWRALGCVIDHSRTERWCPSIGLLCSWRSPMAPITLQHSLSISSPAIPDRRYGFPKLQEHVWTSMHYTYPPLRSTRSRTLLCLLCHLSWCGNCKWVTNANSVSPLSLELVFLPLHALLHASNFKSSFSILKILRLSIHRLVS